MSRRAIVSSLALVAGLVALWAWAPGAVRGDREPKDPDGGGADKKPACLGEIQKPGVSDSKTGFVEVPYGDDKYVAFIPHDYDPEADTKYPVILFLHGKGAEGKDGWAPTKTGLGPAILQRETDDKPFPFLVVFPQARSPWGENADENCDHTDLDRAVAILDHFTKESDYRGACDLDKVSVSGLSRGGYATWYMAVTYPERWAAMVVVAGSPGCPQCPKEHLLTKAARAKDIPAWFFHGTTDQRVPFDKGQKMVDALKDAGGDPTFTTTEGDEADAYLTQFPKLGTHNGCWFKDVYTGDDLWDWWVEQTRQQQE
jgi:predicted peptidase